MSRSPNPNPSPDGRSRWNLNAAVHFAILLAGAVAATFIFTTEPTATRTASLGRRTARE